MTFYEFGLDDRLLDGIDALNYVNATPVQEQVIPLILEGKDIIASAQTGTGKTAAFLLPVINKLVSSEPTDAVKALIIVPTRELALQIAQTMEGLSYFTSVSSIAVYGGGDGALFANEKKALVEGAEMVICTPGRMLTHLNLGYVKLDQLEFLVLDEADRMLDMGFNEDIMKIISHLPPKRQNLLFSATMPHKIRELARKILNDPAEINIAISKPPAKIVQEAFVVYEAQKAPLVKYLLGRQKYNSVIIFCSTKQQVKQLTSLLQRSGLNVKEIHSDLEQQQREQVLLEFKNLRLNVLVATDIVSRGIDIDSIDLVINFDVPHDGEDYVHRIGRTARAESDGTAYTLISPQEQNKFSAIESLLGYEVTKAEVPKALGEVPAYTPRQKKQKQGPPQAGGKKHKNKRRFPPKNNKPKPE